MLTKTAVSFIARKAASSTKPTVPADDGSVLTTTSDDE
jgi:hypothetical protein